MQQFEKGDILESVGLWVNLRIKYIRPVTEESNFFECEILTSNENAYTKGQLQTFNVIFFKKITNFRVGDILQHIDQGKFTVTKLEPYGKFKAFSYSRHTEVDCCLTSVPLEIWSFVNTNITQIDSYEVIQGDILIDTETLALYMVMSDSYDYMDQVSVIVLRGEKQGKMCNVAKNKVELAKAKIKLELL